MSISDFFTDILDGIEWVGEELATFGSAIETFLGIAGPAGMKVATDIATDVATGAVTPVAAATQLADLSAFVKAIQLAAATAKGSVPTPAAPAVTPTQPVPALSGQ